MTNSPDNLLEKSISHQNAVSSRRDHLMSLRSQICMAKGIVNEIGMKSLIPHRSEAQVQSIIGLSSLIGVQENL